MRRLQPPTAMHGDTRFIGRSDDALAVSATRRKSLRSAGAGPPQRWAIRPLASAESRRSFWRRVVAAGEDRLSFYTAWTRSQPRIFSQKKPFRTTMCAKIVELTGSLPRPAPAAPNGRRPPQSECLATAWRRLFPSSQECRDENIAPNPWLGL